MRSHNRIRHRFRIVFSTYVFWVWAVLLCNVSTSHFMSWCQSFWNHTKSLWSNSYRRWRSFCSVDAVPVTIFVYTSSADSPSISTISVYHFSLSNISSSEMDLTSLFDNCPDLYPHMWNNRWISSLWWNALMFSSISMCTHRFLPNPSICRLRANPFLETRKCWASLCARSFQIFLSKIIYWCWCNTFSRSLCVWLVTPFISERLIVALSHDLHFLFLKSLSVWYLFLRCSLSLCLLNW